jgi:hypothetical protein
MIKYNIFEVDSDGKYHDINRTVDIEYSESRSQYGRMDAGNPVAEVFKIYGFNQYQSSYEIECIENKEYNISYTFPSHGKRPVWYLQKIK